MSDESGFRQRISSMQKSDAPFVVGTAISVWQVMKYVRRYPCPIECCMHTQLCAVSPIVMTRCSGASDSHM